MTVAPGAGRAPVDAIVLAGGDGASLEPSCRDKSAFEVAGRPMLEWVLHSLEGAVLVDRVVVVREPGGDLLDRLEAGAKELGGDRPLLLASSDVPAVTPAAVDSFVSASLETGAEVVYPVVEREDLERAFPGAERTYVRLREGRLTGGNLMLASARAIELGKRPGRSLFAARKSPLAMARLLGPSFVVRLALGRLDIPGLERRLTRMLGVPVAAVRTSEASIGMDVDKPSDVALVERALGGDAERSRQE